MILDRNSKNLQPKVNIKYKTKIQHGFNHHTNPKNIYQELIHRNPKECERKILHALNLQRTPIKFTTTIEDLKNHKQNAIWIQSKNTEKPKQNVTWI